MRRTLVFAAVAAPLLAAAPVQAQEKYIGEIIVSASNFCPRGTMEADGRTLPISNYTALFSLLGTQFGGDGRTTFALPNLVGRVAVGTGRDGDLALSPGDTIALAAAREADPGLEVLPARIERRDRDHDREHRGPENPGVYDLSEPLEHPDAVDAALEAMPEPPHPPAAPAAVTGLALTHCVVTQGLYPARN